MVTFFEEKIWEMFMTAIFMFCSRKRKWFRCNVAEIAGTMLEIVRYFAPEWCVKSLFQKAGILCKGE